MDPTAVPVNETAKAVQEFGVLSVMVALIVWDKIINARTVNKLLAEMNVSVKLQTATLDNLESALAGIRHSCENTTTALRIVNTNMEHLDEKLTNHGRQQDHMNTDVRKILSISEGRDK